MSSSSPGPAPLQGNGAIPNGIKEKHPRGTSKESGDTLRRPINPTTCSVRTLTTPSRGTHRFSKTVNPGACARTLVRRSALSNPPSPSSQRRSPCAPTPTLVSASVSLPVLEFELQRLEPPEDPRRADAGEAGCSTSETSVSVTMATRRMRVCSRERRTGAIVSLDAVGCGDRVHRASKSGAVRRDMTRRQGEARRDSAKRAAVPSSNTELLGINSVDQQVCE